MNSATLTPTEDRAASGGGVTGAPDAANVSRAQRLIAVFATAFWIGVFGWVWLPAPGLVKALAVVWAAVGLVAPNAWLVTLALALPLFGNNPGGPHHLYLLDLGLMGFVCRDLIERALGRRVARPHPLNAPVTAFLWLSAVTLIPQWRPILCELENFPREFMLKIFSHYATAPVYGLRAWLNLALCVGLFRALRDAPAGRGRGWLFAGALLAGGLLAAVLGLLEYTGAISLERWRPPNPNITRFGYPRLMSLFWHSGWFAQYLAGVAPVALAIALTANKRAARVGAFIVAGALALAQVFTMQRGGWLAMIGGTLVVIALHWMRVSPALRRKYARRLAIGMLGAGAMIGALAAVNEPLRRRMGEMLVVRDRALIWRGAALLVRFYPFSGAGLGNYSVAHHLIHVDTTEESKADDRTTAHQLFLHTAAERGIPAAGLLAAIFALALVGLGRAHLKPEAEVGAAGFGLGSAGLRLAAWGGLTALLIDGMFQYTFYMRVTELLAWVWLGVAAAPGVADWTLAGAKTAGTGRFMRGWRIGFTMFGAAACLVFAVNSRAYFKPFKFYEGSEGFLVGGKRVDLMPPEGARKVSIRVATFDPSVVDRPVTYSFFLGRDLLAVHVFEERTPATVTLSLPPGRDSSKRLIIRADRVWRPYVDSWGTLPITVAGVCYQPPEKAE